MRFSCTVDAATNHVGESGCRWQRRDHGRFFVDRFSPIDPIDPVLPIALSARPTQNKFQRRRLAVSAHVQTTNSRVLITSL